jgi:hypothetical protein
LCEEKSGNPVTDWKSDDGNEKRKSGENVWLKNVSAQRTIRLIGVPSLLSTDLKQKVFIFKNPFSKNCQRPGTVVMIFKYFCRKI